MDMDLHEFIEIVVRFYILFEVLYFINSLFYRPADLRLSTTSYHSVSVEFHPFDDCIE